MKGNPLMQLRDLGQSVWLDDISRKLVSGGALDALVSEDGVSGVTSNPSIFQKAVSQSADYDEAITTLAARGKGALAIRETLVVNDIISAADKLAPVFAASGGTDGWVSLEVDPTYAYDTGKTVAEAVRLRGLVNRQNVMIKVPATREGVSAVRELISLGYCINVTLIFSLERYREVMEAYLGGLESLQSRGAIADGVPALNEVHSVASFFVSRIDTVADRRLEVLGAEKDSRSTGGVSAEGLEGLRGKAAIANAKRAYRSFQETFFGPRWDSLRANGANLQRPLWASTSTKNPDYSDIMYVQELIGPNTVSTMPADTMDAFRDHGIPKETLTVDVYGANRHLEALAEAGVDMEEVAADLEKNGVKSFSESFDALLNAIKAKATG